jgi:hypothetical protein
MGCVLVVVLEMAVRVVLFHRVDLQLCGLNVKTRS